MGDSFGWEFESYCDPQSKFSYYLVALRDWLTIMQKNEYGERHNFEKDWGDYSFSFGSLTQIARAKEKTGLLRLLWMYAGLPYKSDYYVSG